MPHLTFSMQADEMTLEAVIGLHGRGAALLSAAGQPFPSPIVVVALIDTGSSISCVAPRVLHAPGLSAWGQGTSQTTSGTVTANVYEVSLTIPPADRQQGPSLVRDQLLVMELTQSLASVEAIIGQDVLRQC